MRTLIATFLVLLAAPAALGQHHHHSASAVDSLFHQQASGTSLLPASTPMEMMMFSRGGWSAMLHGVAFYTSMEQSGPRGDDDQFSTNWLMFSASRKIGTGALLLRTMLSAEPWTIGDRRYGLLFQTGETAFGRPIIDGQHPHELFMELAVEYARPIGSGTGYVYAAPVGDPALGPVAFPHRASAAEIPQAVLSHHFQDSTHISYNVVTLGYRVSGLTFEASGFHGGEPDEERSDIDGGAIDSVSARVSWAPTPNLVAQISAGYLKKPEVLEPRNQNRRTASVAYTRGQWSSSLIYGQVYKQSHSSNLDAYLAETVFRLGTRHSFTARVERSEKDELFPHFHPPNRPDFAPSVATFTITSLLAGYTFDVLTGPPVRLGIGANVTTYRFPDVLAGFYGDDPLSTAVFVRARLTGN